MHWENGKDYSAACCAVASCDTVDGNYVYHGSFNPAGEMSRDCTLFVDDDGTAYFVSAARGNADLHIYRLSEDYLAIEEHVKTLWPGQYRETPALVKHEGVYFLLTSGCTGWEPNQGKYAYADSITGEWSELFDFGGPTTFDTQPTYILPVKGSHTTSYYYVGDRWDPSNYHSSSYVILPLEFPENKKVTMRWADTVEWKPETGLTAAGRREMSGLWRIRNGTNRYLAPQGEAQSSVAAQKLSYASDSQLWMQEAADGGFVRIKNKATGFCLESRLHDQSKDISEVMLMDASDRPTQLWSILTDESSGRCSIQNSATGQVLALNEQFDGVLHTAPRQADPKASKDQTFLLAEHYGVYSKETTPS